MKQRRTKSPWQGKAKMKRISVGTQCVICLEDVTVRGRLGSCEHLFCFSCIKEWAQVTNSCPLCKRNFRCIKKSTLSGGECSSPETIRVADKQQQVWYDDESPPDDTVSEYTDPSYDSDLYDLEDSFINDNDVTVSWTLNVLFRNFVNRSDDSLEFQRSVTSDTDARNHTPPITRARARAGTQSRHQPLAVRAESATHQSHRTQQSVLVTASEDSDSGDDSSFHPAQRLSRNIISASTRHLRRSTRLTRQRQQSHSSSPDSDTPLVDLRQRLMRRRQNGRQLWRSTVQPRVAENLRETGSSGWLGRPSSSRSVSRSHQNSPEIVRRSMQSTTSSIRESRNQLAGDRREFSENSCRSPPEHAIRVGESSTLLSTPAQQSSRSSLTGTGETPSGHIEDAVWLLPSSLRRSPQVRLHRCIEAQHGTRHHRHGSHLQSPSPSTLDHPGDYALSPATSLLASPIGEDLNQAFSEGDLASDIDLFATSPEIEAPISTPRQPSAVRSHSQQKDLHGSWSPVALRCTLSAARNLDRRYQSRRDLTQQDITPLRSRLTKRMNGRTGLSLRRCRIELSDSDDG